MQQNIDTSRRGVKQRVWSRALYFLDQKARQLRWKAALGYLRSVGVRNPGKIFSFTQPEELLALMRIAMDCRAGAIAVEIGSHLGASAVFIAGALAKRGGHLYCIDTWNNETMPDGQRDTFPEFQRNVEAVAPWITPMRGWSTTIDHSQIRGPVSVAFIDGDHSYEAVRADMEYFRPILADEVVVAFHDCNSHAGVARYVGELLASGEWIIAGNALSLLWIKRAKWGNGKGA